MLLNGMKQEDKDLLLQDLCTRLPYGVKCWHESFTSTYTLYAIDSEHSAVNLSPDGLNFDNSWWNNIEQVKPYLFPLSSMTMDQRIEYSKTLVIFDESHCSQTYETYDWLNKNHFDYRGLIPKGLAIDCTNLNIY